VGVKFYDTEDDEGDFQLPLLNEMGID